jgi:hypothetical protein
VRSIFPGLRLNNTSCETHSGATDKRPTAPRDFVGVFFLAIFVWMVCCLVKILFDSSCRPHFAALGRRRGKFHYFRQLTNLAGEIATMTTTLLTRCTVTEPAEALAEYRDATLKPSIFDNDFVLDFSSVLVEATMLHRVVVWRDGVPVTSFTIPVDLIPYFSTIRRSMRLAGSSSRKKKSQNLKSPQLKALHRLHWPFRTITPIRFRGT